MRVDGCTDRHTDTLITIFDTPTSGDVIIVTLKITKKIVTDEYIVELYKKASIS